MIEQMFDVKTLTSNGERSRMDHVNRTCVLYTGAPDRRHQSIQTRAWLVVTRPHPSHVPPPSEKGAPWKI